MTATLLGNQPHNLVEQFVLRLFALRLKSFEFFGAFRFGQVKRVNSTELPPGLKVLLIARDLVVLFEG